MIKTKQMLKLQIIYQEDFSAWVEQTAELLKSRTWESFRYYEVQMLMIKPL